MTNRAKIVLADDDEALTAELSQFLERSGFEVAVAHDGGRTLNLVESFGPDLVILDILMPVLNGREVCRRLRAAGNWTPLIMLTQVGGSAERVMSFEEGADDYVDKPFDPAELVARMRAVLRRSLAAGARLASAQRLVSGELAIDRPSRRVFLGDKEVAITTRAFALLEFLMLHQGETIGRGRVMAVLWGWDDPVATRAVDARIAELRRALQDDAENPRYIQTVVGEGYRFALPVQVGS